MAGGARRRGRGPPRRARPARCRQSVARARRRARHERGRLRVGALRQGRRSAPTTSTRSSATACPRRSRSACPHATIADLRPRRRRSCVLGVDLKEELPVLYLRAQARRGRARRPARSTSRPGDHGPHAVLRGDASASRPASRATVARRARAALGGAAPATTPVDAAASSPRSAGPRRRHRGRARPGQPRRVGRRDRRRGRGARSRLGDRRASSSRSGAATCAARSTSASRPASCPGGSTLDAGRDWFERGVGRGARRAAGLDAAGILAGPRRRAHRRAGAARRRPARRLPRPDPRRGAALDAARVRDRGRHVPHRERRARRRVPARHHVGRAGRHASTNLEGRVPAGRAEGLARRHADARLAHRGRARAALRRRLRPRDGRGGAGRDRARRARPSPASTRTCVRRAVDGVVLPIAEHRDEIVLRPLAHPGHRRVVGADPPLAEATTRRPEARIVARRGPARPRHEPGLDRDRADADDRAGRGRGSGRGRARGRRVRRRASLGRRRRRHRGPGARRLRSAPRERAAPSTTAASTVTASPSLAPLGAPAVLLVHRPDRDRIGVDDGGEVRVTSAARLARRCRSAPTPPMPPGTAFLAFNLPGPGAGDARRRERRRSPTCGWSRCGDARDAPGADPLFATASTSRSCSS